jgi:hypothetical protein
MTQANLRLKAITLQIAFTESTRTFRHAIFAFSGNAEELEIEGFDMGTYSGFLNTIRNSLISRSMSTRHGSDTQEFYSRFPHGESIDNWVEELPNFTSIEGLAEWFYDNIWTGTASKDYALGHTWIPAPKRENIIFGLEEIFRTISDLTVDDFNAHYYCYYQVAAADNYEDIQETIEEVWENTVYAATHSDIISMEYDDNETGEHFVFGYAKSEEANPVFNRIPREAQEILFTQRIEDFREPTESNLYIGLALLVLAVVAFFIRR